MGETIKPFIIYGGTYQKRKEYAQHQAMQNNMDFQELTDFGSLRKLSVTSSLENQKFLYFIDNAENIKETAFLEFLDAIKDSPHRFILSTSEFYKTAPSLKSNCLKIRLGEPELEPLFRDLHILLTEKDRDKARLLLKDADAELMFNILKQNAWKGSEQMMNAVLELQQKVYKHVSPKMFKDAFVYNIPPEPIPLSFNKEKVIPVFLEHILGKIKKRLHTSTSQTAEAYFMLKKLKSAKVACELGFTEEERHFLGVAEPKMEEQIKQIVKVMGLDEFL